MRRRLCPKEALFTPSFIAVCSANLLFFIASFMMVPVLPIYLLDGLHASKSVVGIILSAYMIGALVMRPFWRTSSRARYCSSSAVSCSPPSLRDTCCSTRWRSWASSGHCTA